MSHLIPREKYRMDALLELLLQHWPGVLFRQRPDLTFEVASPQLEAMTGLAVEEWKTQPELFWKVIHELDVDLVKQHLAEVTVEAEGKSCSFRVRHQATGRVACISEFRRAVRDESGGLRSYEGFWTDVTQQALAERRLATAAWKETLGLLTLGLSHDFNNLLAGIMGLSETYLTQIDQTHPFREGLSLVTRNTQQAAQLIRRIGQLHQGKTGTRGYHDLNALVTEGVELLGKVIPRRIEVLSDLASGQLPLYVDPVDFQHVMINLALNAADAMPERGRMVIRTFETAALPEAPYFAGAPPRLPSACFELTDTGHGIKTRHLPFIFDPFFTTKPMNRSSGLGLYNAKLFVEKHDGMISVETEEGKGTAVVGDFFKAGGVNHGEAQIEQLGIAFAQVAGHAGLVIDQCQLAAHEAVEKRGLAHVGAAHDGEGEAHGSNLRSRSRPLTRGMGQRKARSFPSPETRYRTPPAKAGAEAAPPGISVLAASVPSAALNSLRSPSEEATTMCPPARTGP